jgi:hypothetical protein|tara:strand:+ start:723 stop:1727 length:1005 start_codon:yes stop_codon:yes gene_type:complete
VEVATMSKKLRKNSTSLTWRFGAELEGIFRNMNADTMQQAVRDHLGVDKAPKVIREHQGSNHLEFAFYGANITRGNDGLDTWETLLAFLKGYEFIQNGQTGLHVHHDTANLTPLEVANTLVYYHNYRDVLELSLPSSRQGYQANLSVVSRNVFQRVRNKAIQYIAEGKADNLEYTKDFIADIAIHFSHCQDISVNREFGTIEFRKGIATLEFDKFQNWVLITQGFLKYAKQTTKKGKKPFNLHKADRIQSYFYNKPCDIEKMVNGKINPEWADFQLSGSRSGKLWACRQVYQYIAENYSIGNFQANLINSRHRTKHPELFGMCDYFESLNRGSA